MLIALLLSIGIGGVMGLLGGGGSILAVPMLIGVLGMEERMAMATSLAVVVSVALASLVPHYRAGNVEVRQALSFSAVGALGALAAGKVSQFIPSAVLVGIFALAMLVTGVTMLRDRADTAVATGAAPPKPLRIAAAALAAGVLTGLVGAGGGFVIVPALTLLAKMPMRRAVGTSLLVIALQGVAGLAGHLGHVTLDFGLVAKLAGVAAVGSLFGAQFAARVPAMVLKRAFGILILAVAAWVTLRGVSSTAGVLGALAAAGLAAARLAWQARRTSPDSLEIGEGPVALSAGHR